VKARVQLPSDVVPAFEAYFRLLAQWNVKINLTALPLEPPTDDTFDRLFIEPLLAATFVPPDVATWFDLGSGGGSPAVPLKLVRPALALTLVESKTRKAAFLREVTRVLPLSRTEVANVRFEEFAASTDHRADLITVRAVRPDSAFLKVAAQLMKVDARLLLFGKPSSQHVAPAELELDSAELIAESARMTITSFKRVFHVEQSH
jgi:16S rRNA (guanine527-N7)-methyltransferase